MKVSIITVAFNSRRTIEDTITSVIHQNYSDIEYIVIDGGSTDGTLDLLKRYEKNIHVLISEHDNGIYDAMNKGLRQAKGDIIGFLNSDDLFASPDVISKVVTTFEADPTLDGVHGDLYYVGANNVNKVIRYWKTKEYTPGAFMRGWHPAHPTLYLRRRVYEENSGFNTSLSLSADFELMLRLFECAHIRTRHLDEVMIKMRIGGATSKNMYIILKGILQCRRAFRMNGMPYPVFYPLYRLVPKLKQFTALRKKNSGA